MKRLQRRQGRHHDVSYPYLGISRYSVHADGQRDGVLGSSGRTRATGQSREGATVSVLDRHGVNTEIKAERELSQDLSAYIGKWVAVRDHTVICHADSPAELLEAIGDVEVDGVFQVLEERTAACFF